MKGLTIQKIVKIERMFGEQLPGNQNKLLHLKRLMLNMVFTARASALPGFAMSWGQPRKRGRPKKVTVAIASRFDGPKRGVGRPRKATAVVVNSDGSMVVEGEAVKRKVGEPETVKRKVGEGKAAERNVGEGEAVKRKVGRPSMGWKEEREASKARMAAKRARREFEVEKRAYLKRTDQAEFRGERMSRKEAQRLG